MIFQFTASYEADRTWDSIQFFLSSSFNSQPHTRLTQFMFMFCKVNKSFNSQPHTRLTYSNSNYCSNKCLSIHSLIRGWPVYQVRNGKQELFFQFTASYEADRDVMAAYRVREHFQFTASYEADPSGNILPKSTISFNSQPHTRLTPHRLLRRKLLVSFNSQPHTRLTGGYF